MIVNAFLNLMRDAMYGDSVTMPSHMAVGTGTTAPTANDTALEIELFLSGGNRNTISTKSKASTKTVRYRMTVLSSEGNGSTLTEVGAVNAATGGTFMNRFVHPGIIKTSSFELMYQTDTIVSEV